jgi:cytochrome b subunit of formate dehydrogenase
VTPPTRPGQVLRYTGPIRLIHWAHVVVTLLLAVTGFYLDWPSLPPHLLRVATVRLVHLTLASALTATTLFHLVFAVTSGSWRTLIPTRQDWRSLGGTARHELLLTEVMPPHRKYHVLQKLLYLSFLPAVAVEVATGWALAAYQTPTGSLLIRWAGGLSGVRLAHYYVALYLVLTATGHFYRVLSEPGSLVAMLTGWAFDVPSADTEAERATRPPRWR